MIYNVSHGIVRSRAMVRVVVIWIVMAIAMVMTIAITRAVCSKHSTEFYRKEGYSAILCSTSIVSV